MLQHDRLENTMLSEESSYKGPYIVGFIYMKCLEYVSPWRSKVDNWLPEAEG